MSGPNPRAAAVSALVKQEQDGFSNLVLDAELKRQQLEGRDTRTNGHRGFVYRGCFAVSLSTCRPSESQLFEAKRI